MRIFNRDGKINFVDENNVFLGYDMNQCCCEQADWFIADTPQELEELPEPLPEMNREGIPNLEGFVFDPAFFRGDDDREFYNGSSRSLAIFRIVKEKGEKAEKFIHLLNAHNGYYGHGFEFTNNINGDVIRDGVL